MTAARDELTATGRRLAVAIWALSQDGSFTADDVRAAFPEQYRGKRPDTARKDWRRTRSLIARTGIRLEHHDGTFRIDRWRVPERLDLDATETRCLREALARDASDAMVNAHLRRSARKFLLAGMSVPDAVLDRPFRERWTPSDALQFQLKEALVAGQRVVAVLRELPHDEPRTVVLTVGDVDAEHHAFEGWTKDGVTVRVFLPHVVSLRRVQHDERDPPPSRAAPITRRPPLMTSRELLSSAFFALAFLDRAGPRGLTFEELRRYAGFRDAHDVAWLVDELRAALDRHVDLGLFLEVRRDRATLEGPPSALAFVRALNPFEAAAVLRSARKCGCSTPALKRKILSLVHRKRRPVAEALAEKRLP
jgi:hypothetical protein